jgi:hypothetical protein
MPDRLGEGHDLSIGQIASQDGKRAPRDGIATGSLAISMLRLDGHANIAAANRHHARDPQRTLKLLQTA